MKMNLDMIHIVLVVLLVVNLLLVINLTLKNRSCPCLQGNNTKKHVKSCISCEGCGN
jgi:hypothetical protein